MHNKLQQYMSELSSNIEKEGEALKEYESFLTRLKEDCDMYEYRLQQHEDYDEDSGVLPMQDEEVEECKKCVEGIKSLMGKIREIISDEINHVVVLTGCLVEYGCVKPSADNLASAIVKITNGGDNNDY